jgi:hypothetical protein
MNFKMFMYYCAICGGWAALIAWALQQFAGMQNDKSYWAAHEVQKSAVIACLLGLLVAGIIGLLDALLNSVGFSRVVRLVICLAVGFVGSLIAGGIGELLRQALQLPPTNPRNPTSQIWAMPPGWTLVGAIIGASIGIFDLLRAASSGKGMKQAIRKIVNGIIGGTIGGFIGGLVNGVFHAIELPKGIASDPGIDLLKEFLPMTSLAVGLVILGMCIGLLIGVAQVVLKEAWVKIERGFRAGREMILTKPEVLIGRAEGVDIALFGDMQVEKQHARIVLKGDRYILVDLDTPGGTTVNGQRITGPTPLSNGDVIGCGNSQVRFNERARR